MPPTRAILLSISTSNAPESPGAYTLTPDNVHIIGRSSVADLKLIDPGISRKHTEIRFARGDWWITDLNSRHGTLINAQRLASGDSIVLRDRDQISLGGWKCTFQLGEPPSVMQTMVDPAGSRVEAVEATSLTGIAQDQLQALMNATRELANAQDVPTIARMLRDAAISGTGASRVYVVRQSGEDTYSILAPDDAQDATLSSSLLHAARSGQVVELFGSSNAPIGQSIMELDIRSAISAPLMVLGTPDSFLYLDTRAAERNLSRDTAAFCTALSSIGGLAIERVLAAEMEDRRAAIERDVLAARSAQELLMPSPQGDLECARYAFHASPGRFVAGDFFDVVRLSGKRVAFYLGDVSGKGAAAGVVMAAAQGQMRALLQQGLPLADVTAKVNKHLCERTKDGTFVTLVAAVWDAEQSSIEMVDAGHGFCCIQKPGNPPELIKVEGGFPLGIADAGQYEPTTLAIPSGARVLFWSDGAVEQTNDQGTQFGVDAVLKTLDGADAPITDVRLLADAVIQYAGGPLADDLTIASVELLA